MSEADPKLLQGLKVKIVIMGKMASGKTFASGHLVNDWGGSSWTVAERIKQIAHALVDQNGDLGALLQLVVEDDDLVDLATRELLKFAERYEPEPGDKPRRLYQEVGQILRDLDPRTQFCWEEDLERRIQAYPSNLTVVDIRAKESFRFFVGERGYASMLIVAPEDVRMRRMISRDSHAVTDPQMLGHVSETDVDELDFEFVVHNPEDDPSKLFSELDRIVMLLAERSRHSQDEQPRLID
jgi:hypothetical protein